MESKNFKNYESELLNLLKPKLEAIGAKDPKGFNLVDGFITGSIQDGYNNVVVGGKTIPLVAVIGKSTYIVHYFAALPLIKEIDEGKKDE